MSPAPVPLRATVSGSGVLPRLVADAGTDVSSHSWEVVTIATLRYCDATLGQYVAFPAIPHRPLAIWCATILTTPTVASSPYTITHNMSTTNVMVQAWDTVTNDLIVVRMHVADANHVQVFFEQNAPNNVNVLVVGGAGSLAPAPVVAARARNVSATTQSFPGNTVLTYDTLGVRHPWWLQHSDRDVHGPRWVSLVIT